MLMRMQIASPTVYEVNPDDRVSAEDNWGWMKLCEIAQVADLPNFFILMHFLEFGTPPRKINGRTSHVFYYRRTPCGCTDEWELRSLVTRSFDVAYENCRCDGTLSEVGLNRYVTNHEIMVPARWGLQVLAELKKHPLTFAH